LDVKLVSGVAGAQLAKIPRIDFAAGVHLKIKSSVRLNRVP